MWETKARRIKIRGKPKSLRKINRRAIKKKSPAINNRLIFINAANFLQNILDKRLKAPCS